MDIDVGSISREKTIKQGLHCKPFRYFLEFVAPEMLERYPLEERGYFTKGTIRSKSSPNFCVEVSRESDNDNDMTGKLVLNKCENNHVKPSTKQSFSLTWHRNIQNDIYDYCIDNSLAIIECHFHGGNQLWKFDLVCVFLVKAN